MSGAQLEISGQIRNVFPLIVSQGFHVSLALTVANSFTQEVPINFTSALPFGKGLDRPSRIFLGMNNLSTAQRVDAGTTTNMRGALYFRGLDGRKVYLQAYSQTVSTVGNANSTPILIAPEQAISADQLSPLGYIGYEDNGGTIGTATVLNVEVYINIGFYGDYAEPDYETLFTMPIHEHTGLSVYRNGDDD